MRLAQPELGVITVRDGRIVHVRGHCHDGGVLTAFLGPRR